MQLRKVERTKAKLRIGFSSISGGGKTVSALLVAYGITGDWNKIAVIDSENNSADLYANHKLSNGVVIGEFHVLPLEAPYSPERYIEAINVCEDNQDIEVLIIDSISHEWEGNGGVISIADQLGGSFNGAWKNLTPRHEAWKNAILKSRCHVFTTVRRKQEYIIIEDVNKSGKSVQKPIKAGLKEITRDGWEYELTLNLELDISHNATASKDRTGLFMDKPSFVPSIASGELLRDWCDNGVDVELQIKEAILKLNNCNTVDDLKTLKEILPEYVTSSKEFKIAGGDRYKFITKPADTAQNA